MTGVMHDVAGFAVSVAAFALSVLSGVSFLSAVSFILGGIMAAAEAARWRLWLLGAGATVIAIFMSGRDFTAIRPIAFAAMLAAYTFNAWVGFVIVSWFCRAMRRQSSS